MSRKILHLLLASVLGFLHILAADILFFYGTVIDPQIQHKVLSTIAFIVSLPFSTLLLVPGIGHYFLIVQVSLFVFWIAFYYWITLKICKGCSLRCSPT